MNAFERLHAAISGDTPDHVPVSVWFHFGSEHLPPAAVADLHAKFHAAYRWDFLKVMFDYRMQAPCWRDGRAELDVDALLAEANWRAPFLRQQHCLRILHAELGHRVPLFETVYSPWMYLLRHVGRDRKEALLDRPDLTVAILDRIAAATLAHIDFLKELGIYGVYFATIAADAAACEAEIALQSGGDLAVLGRAEGLARILHLHGGHICLERARHHPREVLHCEDRDPTNPGLAALRDAERGAIMGGLPHATLTQIAMPTLRAMIDDAIRRGGRDGFILAPGCSVSPSLAGQTMLDIREQAILRSRSLLNA